MDGEKVYREKPQTKLLKDQNLLVRLSQTQQFFKIKQEMWLYVIHRDCSIQILLENQDNFVKVPDPGIE